MDLDICCCVHHLFFSISSCNQMSLQVHPLCSKPKKNNKGERNQFHFVVEERENEIVDFVVVVWGECVWGVLLFFVDSYLQCLE